MSFDFSSVDIAAATPIAMGRPTGAAAPVQMFLTRMGKGERMMVSLDSETHAALGGAGVSVRHERIQDVLVLAGDATGRPPRKSTRGARALIILPLGDFVAWPDRMTPKFALRDGVLLVKVPPELRGSTPARVVVMEAGTAPEDAPAGALRLTSGERLLCKALVRGERAHDEVAAMLGILAPDVNRMLRDLNLKLATLKAGIVIRAGVLSMTGAERVKAALP